MKKVVATIAFYLAALPFAAAQDLGKPLLLVASPALQGFYNHTTLVAVPMGDTHVGFIVNRATEITLGALFPDHPPSAKVAGPVYLGGPDMVEAIFAVVRRDPGPHSLKLFGDVFVAVEAEDVERVIEQTPNDARYFAGFVGWQPGELAKEIEGGYWYVGEPEAGLFFRNDTSEMWEELVDRLGGAMPRGARPLQGAQLSR
jgi:putative transcriptional regulator